MSDAKVVEFAGKFLAQVDGKIKEFDTLAAAEGAVVLEENSEAFRARAEAFCEAHGLESKNAVAKTRIITDFLCYEATQEEEEVDEA